MGWRRIILVVPLRGVMFCESYGCTEYDMILVGMGRVYWLSLAGVGTLLT